jgi:hypothetical protein
MALVATISAIPVLSPAYTDSLIITLGGGTGSTVYYKVDMYINSVLTDSFKCPANPTTYTAEINLSTLLSTYFTSQVYTPVSDTTIHALIPNSIVPFYITATLYSATGSFGSTVTSNIGYVFNGCQNKDDNFLIADYIMQNNSTLKGNFLTNWATERAITLNDKAVYLNAILGNYGTGLISAYGGIKVTRYQFDGSSAYVQATQSDNTTKGIMNVNISPYTINSTFVGTYPNGFIDLNTNYYTIEEANGRSKTIMRINILNEKKLNKYYNFVYLNRFGGLDFFTATKASQNTYTISRKVLDQFIVQKPYGSTVERKTSVSTDALSAYQAEGIKDLFTSPAVKLFFNNTFYDVRIVNEELIVPDVYPKELCYYLIDFQYNSKTYVQLY